MHTATICLTINIDKLIELVDNKYLVSIISINRIDSRFLDRNKRTGFSKRRYEECDISYPILVTDQLHLIDGRHRLLKLIDSGKKYVKVIKVSMIDIGKCLVIN